MNYKLILKIINNSISKDETRSSMNSAYRKGNVLYSTCGRTMAAMQNKGSDGYCIVNEKTLEIIDTPNVKGEFPNCKRVASKMDDVNNYTLVRATIPNVKVAKKPRYGEGAPVSLTKEGAFIFGPCETALVKFDLKFIELLAGEEVYIWVKTEGSMNNAIVVSWEAEFTSSTFFLLIMPLRA